MGGKTMPSQFEGPQVSYFFVAPEVLPFSFSSPSHTYPTKYQVGMKGTYACLRSKKQSEKGVLPKGKRSETEKNSSREDGNAQAKAFLFKVKSNTWVDLSQTCFLRPWKPRTKTFLPPHQRLVDLKCPRCTGLIHVFGCWVQGQEHRKK